MKCIYFVQYFPPEKSSGSDLVEDLLEGFVKHGWDVELFTPTPTRGVSDEQRKEYTRKRVEKKYDGKLTIHRMPLYREGKGFISRTLRYVFFSIECFWKAVTVPADFIFTGSGPPTQGVVVGLVRKFSRKKKFIYNLQDIFPDSLVTSGICREDSILMKIGHIMENFTYQNTDVIITISDDMKANVISKGIVPEKVKVVRNWIDVNRIYPVAPGNNKLFEELNLKRGNFYVVYAGNLGKTQGVEVILRAAELLNGFDDIHFIIFGNGSEEESIKKQAKNINNISVFPLLPMSRVPEVYSLGNISIIPCKKGTGHSGMPSKVWTIMATGSVIIGSFDTDSDLASLLNESGCGFCVEPENPVALSNAIRSLYGDEKKIVEMGQNGRNYVEKNVSKSISVNRYIDIISEILNV